MEDMDNSNYRDPSINAPVSIVPSNTSVSEGELQRRVNENIGWLPALPASKFMDFPALSKWMKHHKMAAGASASA
eukprot:CAMPEP_0197463320 /NCGR_PEP_ID=MMETSP1175-20131217/61470_1 /TAXON_ID=1003142 /ORGANISM="Triceratium dubium, Strain CCMP147" /LENGTH=74 /DNA_ID=CAMNT_0042999051 /DNA_START=9 /DNA_END=229 /DNA_ORIENTATION=+